MSTSATQGGHKKHKCYKHRQNAKKRWLNTANYIRMFEYLMSGCIRRRAAFETGTGVLR